MDHSKYVFLDWESSGQFYTYGCSAGSGVMPVLSIQIAQVPQNEREFVRVRCSDTYLNSGPHFSIKGGMAPACEVSHAL